MLSVAKHLWLCMLALSDVQEILRSLTLAQNDISNEDFPSMRMTVQ